MYTLIYLTLFTFKLEPTEVQDAAKSQIWNFSSCIGSDEYTTTKQEKEKFNKFKRSLKTT